MMIRTRTWGGHPSKLTEMISPLTAPRAEMQTTTAIVRTAIVGSTDVDACDDADRDSSRLGAMSIINASSWRR